MDHVDVVLEGDLDNLVAGEISSNGRVLAAVADLVGLIGFLSMHGKAVFMTVDGDGVQRQLVSCTEDSDWDLSTVGHCRSCQRGREASRGQLSPVRTQELLQLHDGAAGAQPVVHRVSVWVVLAMLVIEFIVINGRRRRSCGRSLVRMERSHGVWPQRGELEGAGKRRDRVREERRRGER